MLQVSLEMLKKDYKKIFNFVSTVAIISCISTVLLQFFNNPEINYVTQIKMDNSYVGNQDLEFTTNFFDGLYKGSMIFLLLIIFTTLIIYSCSYYNKTHSQIIGQLKMAGLKNYQIAMYQIIQLVLIILIGYLMGVALSIIIIPMVQYFAYLFIGINQSSLVYSLNTFIQSLAVFGLLLIIVGLVEMNYAIKTIIVDLLKKDTAIIYKRRKERFSQTDCLYVFLFIVGIASMYMGKLTQGLVFPVCIGAIGAYGIIERVIPELYEEKLENSYVESKQNLVYRNYLMNLLELKSLFLMFFLVVIILSTMIYTNYNNKHYSVLFHLSYFLSNIALSYTLANRFTNKRLLKKRYYRNLSRLGLNKIEIVKMAQKEIILVYLTLLGIGILFLVNLMIGFALSDHISWLFGMLLIGEFIIPLFISSIVTLVKEKRFINYGSNN
ncbi:hypothetical protein [Thomasclavelia sp.]|uniref:hypothetical protein n=1 Tax=Thomasclavelia sp. TaxID=3025757 RepID=UPI0025F63CB4|nr:hypothetical protein [Thomasclavelia sp.]